RRLHLHLRRHSRRESSRKWKNNIRIFVGGEKVPVERFVLINITAVFKECPMGHINKLNVMSLSYVASAKETRVSSQPAGGCRIYHDALTNKPLEVLTIFLLA
ncbi:hypothetical protein HAX54_036415, partial [Datura stramonium]|nr:hypothetical protein [Datura stramonium]